MKQLMCITATISRNIRRLAVILLIPYLLLTAFNSPLEQQAWSDGLHQDITWTLDTTVNGVEFYHSLVTCGDTRKVLLRFVNKQRGTVTVKWKESFITRQVSTPTNGEEGVKTLELKPGETKALNCNDSANPACVVNPEKAIPAYRADITGFSFREITVSPD